MRIPLVPDADSRDGTSNKDARLFNILLERDKYDYACVRPGLNQVVASSGNGNSIVCFNGTLINLYGTKIYRLVENVL